jgi:hypothetical protein
VETWQMGMFLAGGVLVLLYFKRRSDRISNSE